MEKRLETAVWITGSAIAASIISISSASAQVATDGTTPLTAIGGNCNATCNITGGTAAGSNRFHSFSQFDVPAGATVNFVDPGVANILGRVTSADASEIFGTLGVTGGTANLFLLNPNGIFFGPNAQLSLSGSFVATTADAIEFGNLGSFSATPPTGENLAVLTINPSALAFNRAMASPITNQSTANGFGLQTTNSSLLLIGGDVRLDGGFVSAFKIGLGGVEGSGRVEFTYNATNDPFPTFPDGTTLADVTLTNGAIANATRTINDAAGIFIRGNNITIENDSQVASSTFGTNGGNAGLLILEADDTLRIDNSFIRSRVEAGSFGNAGNDFAGNIFGDDFTTLLAAILLQARRIELNNNATVTSSTLGIGNAGAVIAIAEDSISLDNSSALLSQTLSGAVGEAGAVLVSTKDFSANNSSFLSTSTFGVGNAGLVLVAAEDSITLDNNSGILSAVLQAAGTGGGVRLDTKSLEINNGSFVSVTSTGTGNAGDIVIVVEGDLSMSRGEISAESLLTGGGNIGIAAENIYLRDSSLISTSVFGGAGGGGDIDFLGLAPERSIFLALQDSDILATAKFGPGGNIRVEGFPVFIADIFARVPSSFVDARIFRGNGRVDISASSEFGLNGNVDVPDFTFLQNSLSGVASNFVSPDQIVAGSCLARRNAEQGSFVVTGTGGLPPTPEDALSERYPVTDVQPLAQPETPSTESPATTEENEQSRNPQPILNSKTGSNDPQGRRPIAGADRDAQTTVVSRFTSNTTPTLSPQPWKLGDPIWEAQGIAQIADGRILAGSLPQLATTTHANDLLCKFADRAQPMMNEESSGATLESSPLN